MYKQYKYNNLSFGYFSYKSFCYIYSNHNTLLLLCIILYKDTNRNNKFFVIKE